MLAPLAAFCALVVARVAPPHRLGRCRPSSRRPCSSSSPSSPSSRSAPPSPRSGARASRGARHSTRLRPRSPSARSCCSRSAPSRRSSSRSGGTTATSAAPRSSPGTLTTSSSDQCCSRRSAGSSTGGRSSSAASSTAKLTLGGFTLLFVGFVASFFLQFVDRRQGRRTPRRELRGRRRHPGARDPRIDRRVRRHRSAPPAFVAAVARAGSGAAGRERPVAGRHARVVHALAAAGRGTSTRSRRSAARRPLADLRRTLEDQGAL